ncbi:hypothetical protein [Nocardiopsis sp. CNT312]|uniref:hypothetical protein n=1 Tax=Nocardiopsis sp. CNT312 TaxID=1137268 RepID=UPI00048EDFB3|nr:hypothetical protein [Nocardiopsis sp. CNT312]
MFPSGQDPYDPDGASSGRGGLFGFGAHFDALHPDAPAPRKVAIVRTLMFIGGACGLALSAMFLMGTAMPSEAVDQAVAEQAEIASGQGVELVVTAEAMRSMMAVMAVVTGVYGLLSTFLASRVRRRTVGVFWGIVVFQTAAALMLGWAVLGGDLLSLVPLGFAVTMAAFMFSREGRAYYGLL